MPSGIYKRIEGKIYGGMKGHHHSQETKQKMSKNRKGEGNGMYNKHHSEETRRKMSLALKDEKHYNWKGDNAGYEALHTWIRKNKFKPQFCEECHEKEPFDIANIKNHQYTRNPKDYKWLCRGCHEKLDRK